MDSKPDRPSPYNNLIDSDTWAFIDATNACYPADAVELTVSQQRELYNAMCCEFNRGRPDNVHSNDFAIGQHNIAIREYRTNASDQSAACVIYYHGGGFVVGSLQSHDDVCAEICAATGYAVYACDYRLAPEHSHPAAFDDALTLFHWANNQPYDNIVLAGDSAGANLAAAVSGSLRESARQPAGQVLIYPYLGGPLDEGSALTHAHAPMLTSDDLKFYHEVRLGAVRLKTDDVSYAPLWANDFSNLPPTVIFSAECDPLCDDGQYYAQALSNAGGKAHWVIERGLVHGYLRARSISDRAASSFSSILRAIETLGRKHWTY